MKPLTISWIFILLLSAACTELPLNGITEDPNSETDGLESVSVTDCESNNTSADCALSLHDIRFEFTDGNCQVHDHMIRISSRFTAPAGLGIHPRSKVEWEFLPRGNAGFWLSPVDAPDSVLNGTLIDLGCFSFGEQDTLRIYHQLTDTDGNSSNIVYTDIPRPSAKSASSLNTSSGATKIESGFEN